MALFYAIMRRFYDSRKAQKLPPNLMKFPKFSHFLVALSFLGLAIGIFSHITSSQAAFGTSPPWVRNDHMLPGTTFEQIINLSRSDTDKAIKAKIQVSGDKELLKWINVENEKDLIMRQGQAILPMKVMVEVPKRAEIKRYSGSIFVSLAPLETSESLGGGEVGITLGANISVDITVIGEKIYEYKLQSISADNLQEDEPLTLNIKIQNLGNVSVNNANGQVEIYNETQTEVIKSLDFIEFEEVIAPDETKTVKMVFDDVILDPGKYWLFVQSFLDGKVEYENRLPLEVSEKIIPIITPEDSTATKPSLPTVSEELETQAPSVEVPVAELREAAPIAEQTNKLYLIFGFVGLGFGLIALIGVIIVLIFVLKNQQRTLQQTSGHGYHGQGNAGNTRENAKNQE